MPAAWSSPNLLTRETGMPCTGIAEIPGHPLYDGLQILIRHGLDNVPIMIEHLNVTAAVPSALLCVTERLFTTIFAAVNRTHAVSLENFPAALLFPTQIA